MCKEIGTTLSCNSSALVTFLSISFFHLLLHVVVFFYFFIFSFAFLSSRKCNFSASIFFHLSSSTSTVLHLFFLFLVSSLSLSSSSSFLPCTSFLLQQLHHEVSQRQPKDNIQGGEAVLKFCLRCSRPASLLSGSEFFTCMPPIIRVLL